MSDLRFAPGCFGAPLCYRADHPVCAPCPFTLECAPVALARRTVLHAHFGIKPRKAKVAAALLRTPAPVKPKPDPKLVFIAKALRARKNPFNKNVPAQRGWWLVANIMLNRPALAQFKAFVFVLTKCTGDMRRSAEHIAKVLSELLRTGVVVRRGELYAIQ